MSDWSDAHSVQLFKDSEVNDCDVVKSMPEHWWQIQLQKFACQPSAALACIIKTTGHLHCVLLNAPVSHPFPHTIAE